MVCCWRMTTVGTREARMKVPAKRRREIASLGAKAMHARLSPAQLREQSRKGGKAAMAKRTPERHREISRLGAEATNRKRWALPWPFPQAGSPAFVPGTGAEQLMRCGRCGVESRAGDLLDGEACPQCRLVL